MSDLLFEITESRLDGAIRWQKRARAAEAKVAELEADLHSWALARGSLEGMCKERTTERDAALARVEVLESQVLDGMPSTANTEDPVPEDQKTYRVWTRSRVVQWQSGPDCWLARDNHRYEDADWFAANCEGWLAEPDQDGEGGL